MFYISKVLLSLNIKIKQIEIMTTIVNILRKGLANNGNSFKITLSDLINQSNMNEDDVCIALNSITQWNAWEMIILD